MSEEKYWCIIPLEWSCDTIKMQIILVEKSLSKIKQMWTKAATLY